LSAKQGLSQSVIPGELVACEVEAFAGEETGVLKDANGDRPDVHDGNLRERPCRRECRRVYPFSELPFYEIEVFHEGNGRENRSADADFGDALFDLVLAVEVQNARLSVGRLWRPHRKIDNSSCVSMTPQRATDTNQILRNVPAKVQYEKTRHIKSEMAGHSIVSQATLSRGAERSDN
jgi:hypothetical protein